MVATVFKNGICIQPMRSWSIHSKGFFFPFGRGEGCEDGI
jgi:hypothetical protein